MLTLSLVSLKQKALTLINHSQGFIFDTLFLVFQLTLAIPFSHFLRKQFDITLYTNQATFPLGLLFLAAALTQTIGILIKKERLKTRVLSSNYPNTGMSAQVGLFALLVIHWIIFMAIFNIGLKTIHFFPFDWPFLRPSLKWTVLFFAPLHLILISIPTLTLLFSVLSIFDSKKTAASQVSSNWRQTPAAEFLANLFLLFSVFVITSIGWTYFLVDDSLTFALHDNITFAARILLTAVFGLLFLSIYLPPRILFLIEDYRYPMTWFRILFVYLPFAWPLLFGETFHLI